MINSIIQIKSNISSYFYYLFLCPFQKVQQYINSRAFFMSTTSAYSEDLPSLGIDEKLIAITMFYNREDKINFRDLFLQSTRMEEKINQMVLNLIEAVIYLTEQELRNRGYLRGTLEIKYILKSLSKTVFIYAKTNYIFKRFILAFFHYGKSVQKFTNQDLIIFYNTVIEQDDKLRTQDVLKYNDRSEKQNTAIEIEIQTQTGSIAENLRHAMNIEVNQQLGYNARTNRNIEKHIIQNQEEIDYEIRLGTSQTETMSVVEVQNKFSKESQQFIELFTMHMKVPKKYHNAKVVMTKTLIVLKKGEPHFTHQYYDSLQGGKIRVVLIGPS